ncbi:MAG: hypothetical protein QM634_10705, partial [Gordonia sp. (in: high G+C Gram-positive bacteria)]
GCAAARGRTPAPPAEPAAGEPDGVVSGAAFTMPTVSDPAEAGAPTYAPPAPPAPDYSAPPAPTPPSTYRPAAPEPTPTPAAPAPPAAPTPQPTAAGRVGDLRDYVTSTGSIPRIETTGSVPVVVGEPTPAEADAPEPPGIRWESSIPPTPGLVTDESREAIAHVNDLPPTPPRRRRPRGESPRDPLNPNWRPPQD